MARHRGGDLMWSCDPCGVQLESVVLAAVAIAGILAWVTIVYVVERDWPLWISD